jgi:short-subunit dehydrogenase
MGDWALVTGASSGIGEAFARELAFRGRPVVVVARRLDRLERLVAEFGGRDRARAIDVDLAPAGGVSRLLGCLESAGLSVDLLVNNAGLGHNGAFSGQPEAALEAMLDVNVRALVALTRALLPSMVARGQGSIVNVASMSSFQPVPYLAVYAATKAFVLSFSEALSVELAGTGVAVQALCPGNIPTEFQEVAGTRGAAYDRQTPATSAAAVARASLDRLASPIVIPAWRDRLTVAALRAAPRALVRRVAGSLFRPR